MYAHRLLQEQNFQRKSLCESLQDHHNNVGYRESQKHFPSATCCNAVYFCALDDPTFSRMGGVNSGTFKVSVGYGFYLRINKSLYLCSFLQILQTIFCRIGGRLRNCLERI